MRRTKKELRGFLLFPDVPGEIEAYLAAGTRLRVLGSLLPNVAAFVALHTALSLEGIIP